VTAARKEGRTWHVHAGNSRVHNRLKDIMDQPRRLHAFGNLRAVMMWLGIVLHAHHAST